MELYLGLLGDRLRAVCILKQQIREGSTALQGSACGVWKALVEHAWSVLMESFVSSWLHPDFACRWLAPYASLRDYGLGIHVFGA